MDVTTHAPWVPGTLRGADRATAPGDNNVLYPRNPAPDKEGKIHTVNSFHEEARSKVEEHSTLRGKTHWVIHSTDKEVAWKSGKHLDAHLVP